MNILEVRNLSVSFDSKAILKDISFSLESGQFLAIVGPNGAGKSTLVKTILKDNRHYSGTIKRGSTVKHIGYVAQQNNDQNYFPATALEVVKSGLTSLNPFPFLNRKDKNRLDAVIEDLELAPLLNKSYFNLSGGQKRAVLIARAFLCGEQFLILDEPTAGLDLSSTERLYECIHNLNAKYKTTICMISHDLKKIVDEADSILCLEHEVKFSGSSDDFKKSSIFHGLLEHSV
ncbi:MAG: metal ABC transporter ATP-binding protein [Succinivibrio sp.]|nr:metal ABC transporter ATP-binding protein [Succinivibrio sp.]